MKKVEKVYSPVHDKDVRKNLVGSPIWKEAYKEEEILDVNKPLWCYWITFFDLTPTQVNKVSDEPLKSHMINLKNDKKRKGNTGRHKK